MSSIHWANIFSTVGGLSGAAAAAGAWRAAVVSNRTADAVARIERDRRQSELTPSFEITAEFVSDDQAKLNVHLKGPVALGYLNEVSISIDDDDMDRTVRLPSGRPDRRPTQEDIDNQVWGPFKFAHGGDGANEFGRTVTPFPLRVGRGRPLNMDRIRAPFWWEGSDANDRWDREQAGTPIRLVLVCRHEDLDPWTIPYPLDSLPPIHMTIG
ncbi:hypothetical protein AB0M28_13375 [Streptomyces sp. NPDC051940]|uniref:hypothetical protein n=1 Tax=Streptomyces sp. NPDC051940 TaxID=3155675 RepID=UPI00342125D1